MEFNITMLTKLLELREFLNAESIPAMTIDWNWIKLYVDAFKDTFETTVRLQHEQLVYSDFFILWCPSPNRANKRQVVKIIY